MNIIDSIVSTTKTRRNVRIMLSIMIYWAKTGQTHHVYDDLIKALGYKQYSGIGKALEKVQEVISEIERRTGKKIPTLNALVKKTPDGLPSYGFEYIDGNYNNYDHAKKLEVVNKRNNEACAYSNWNWVIKELELDTYIELLEKELRKASALFNWHGGGEGAEHKKLKEYISTHPKILGITERINGEVEVPLKSGDILDVLFKLKNGDLVAVEAKPSYSNDSDIERGIYQSVKYKAVMEAMRKNDNQDYNIEVILVTARHLTDKHRSLIDKIQTNHIHFKKKLI